MAREAAVRCSGWRVLLSAQVDGELSSAEERGLGGHLASCPRCREELASLRGVSDALAATTAPDPAFVVRFREHRERRRHRAAVADPGSWPWRQAAVRLLPLAAAALLAAAATVWLTVSGDGLGELEARALGSEAALAPQAGLDPVLRIALRPFPEEGP
jgi:anti-sigma factor RsiW